MPTPNGVNNLLQSLLLLSNSPIIQIQESKVDVPVLCPYMFVAMLPYALKFYWFYFLFPFILLELSYGKDCLIHSQSFLIGIWLFSSNEVTTAIPFRNEADIYSQTASKFCSTLRERRTRRLSASFSWPVLTRCIVARISSANLPCTGTCGVSIPNIVSISFVCCGKDRHFPIIFQTFRPFSSVFLPKPDSIPNYFVPLHIV